MMRREVRRFTRMNYDAQDIRISTSPVFVYGLKGLEKSPFLPLMSLSTSLGTIDLIPNTRR